MLTRDGSAVRQRHLLHLMEQNRWDLFLSSNHRTVYYLTGSLSPADVPTFFVLWGDGSSKLFSSSKDIAFADETIPINSYSIHRAITQPMHDAASTLRDALLAKRQNTILRCAVERAVVPGLVESLILGDLSGQFLQGPTRWRGEYPRPRTIILHNKSGDGKRLLLHLITSLWVPARCGVRGTT